MITLLIVATAAIALVVAQRFVEFVMEPSWMPIRWHMTTIILGSFAIGAIWVAYLLR